MPSQSSSQPVSKGSFSPESDHTVLDSTDQQPKLDSLVSGRNSVHAVPELSAAPTDAGAQSAEADQGQNTKKGKAEGEGRSKNRGSGKGRDQRRKNNKNKNGGNNNHNHGNNSGNGNHGNGNGNRAVAKPQDVDGNTDPDAVGHVGTSLNLTLSKALMTKLKRQAKSEGVSMEALATELITEGCVLRAWEIVERKGHLRDASANQSGNSYGNGNGQRRGNGNTRGGDKQKNGNSRSMNKQRYNAIMDDKASFLEYVRNQEKYNR